MEELLNLSVYDIDLSRTQEEWPAWWQMLRTQGSSMREGTIRTKDDRVVPIEVTTNFMEFEGEEYVCGFVRDITERKETEKALQISEARFRTLFETSPDGVIIDQDGILLYANPAYQQMFGIDDLQKRLGQPYAPIIAPQDLQRVLAISAAREAGEEAPTTYEFTGKRADGVEFSVEVTAAPYEHEGRPAAMAILRDITERKRTHQALLQSEASLAEAQRIAHIGNWGWTVETNELTWSDEVYRIFGLTPQEFDATYDAFLGVVHPDDRDYVAESVNRALEGETYSIDHRIILPQGEERVVHEQAEVTYNDDGKPVQMVGTVQDITESKNTENTPPYPSNWKGSII
jgi:PAS domain S-box-containing protein